MLKIAQAPVGFDGWTNYFVSHAPAPPLAVAQPRRLAVRTMAPPKPTTTRKRNRKRQRRAASSSSSDDDSSSDSDASQVQTASKAPPSIRLPPQAPSSDEEDISSSGNESSEDDFVHHEVAHQQPQTSADPPRRSPSPDPRPCPVSPFPGNPQVEELLRQRFRKFWMSSVADAFSDDLGEIRKVRRFQPLLVFSL